MMIFADFMGQHDIPLRPYGRRADCFLLFASEVPANAKWDLYHLDDYYVSSAVSGPGYVLCGRIRTLSHHPSGR